MGEEPRVKVQTSLVVVCDQKRAPGAIRSVSTSCPAPLLLLSPPANSARHSPAEDHENFQVPPCTLDSFFASSLRTHLPQVFSSRLSRTPLSGLFLLPVLPSDRPRDQELWDTVDRQTAGDRSVYRLGSSGQRAENPASLAVRNFQSLCRLVHVFLSLENGPSSQTNLVSLLPVFIASSPTLR